MADHTITLSDNEESILQAVATKMNTTADALMTTYALNILKSQVVQFLQDECIKKVKNMTAAEKVTFLG